MIFRQTNAPQFFYGLFEGGDEGEALLGFVNGTCCVSEELHHDTMSQCVRDESGRGLGIARTLRAVQVFSTTRTFRPYRVPPRILP